MLNSMKTIMILLIWLTVPVLLVKSAIERMTNNQIDWLTPVLLVFALQWIILSAVSVAASLILDKKNENSKLQR